MQIRRLELQRFRNYEGLETDFSDGTTLFVGPNGAGKTNLLEAISLVLSGQSFRATEELVHRDHLNDGGFIEGYVSTASTENRVTLALSDRQTAIHVDGKRLARPRLMGKFGCCVFSPESMNLIKEGPAVRRQSIDEMVLATIPKAASVYAEFQRALKSRTRILKDHKEGQLSREEATELLQSISGPYLELASEISCFRINAIRRIVPIMKQKMSDILGSQNVDISVNYVISGQAAIAWNRIQVYDALHSRIRELESAELASGYSLVGPQRHDIQFLFEGIDAKYFCSQGQQRALVLALKMAYIALFREERGEFPILLLDDVFSELDIERRGNLLETLQELPTQIFVTTTEVANVRFLRDRKPTVYNIQSGTLIAQDGFSG